MMGGWQLNQPAEPSNWNSGHRKSYPLDPFDGVDLSTWEAIKECGATKRPNRKKHPPPVLTKRACGGWGVQG